MPPTPPPSTATCLTPSAEPRTLAQAGAACTKKCVKAGAKLVVVTDGDQKVIAVDNPDVLTGHEGHHVAVTGTMTGDSMHVDSVKMIAAKSAM